MSLNFPSAPAVNDVYTLGTRNWRFDGAGWVVVPPSTPATSSVNIPNTIVLRDASGDFSTRIITASTATVTSLNVLGFSNFYASQDRFSAITGATGVVTHNLINGSIFYHTTPAANFTANFTNAPTTDNYVTVVVLFIIQGATPRMPTATTNIQIDGVNVIIRFPGGTAPTGTANGVDMVSFSLIRNAGTWVVLGQSGGFS